LLASLHLAWEQCGGFGVDIVERQPDFFCTRIQSVWVLPCQFCHRKSIRLAAPKYRPDRSCRSVTPPESGSPIQPLPASLPSRSRHWPPKSPPLIRPLTDTLPGDDQPCDFHRRHFYCQEETTLSSLFSFSPRSSAVNHLPFFLCSQPSSLRLQSTSLSSSVVELLLPLFFFGTASPTSHIQ